MASSTNYITRFIKGLEVNGTAEYRELDYGSRPSHHWYQTNIWITIMPWVEVPQSRGMAIRVFEHRAGYAGREMRIVNDKVSATGKNHCLARVLTHLCNLLRCGVICRNKLDQRVDRVFGPVFIRWLCFRPELLLRQRYRQVSRWYTKRFQSSPTTNGHRQSYRTRMQGVLLGSTPYSNRTRFFSK